MDPISITTSCLALISAVTGGARCITEFVVNCRDARRDLAAVSRELSELEMTLHILKNDTDGNKRNQLPEKLCKPICDIMQNCLGVLSELQVLLKRYDGQGLDRAARWAISGKKDAEKIRASLEAHKGALSLVVEATTLEYTMKMAEQLAKQDEILKQIAWLRGVVSQRQPNGRIDAGSSSGDRHESPTVAPSVMDEYLDSVTDYAESIYEGSISEDVADGMQRLSLSVNTVDSGALDREGLVLPPLAPDEGIDSMTIVIGNTHRVITPPDPLRPHNKHLWSFFVRTSGEEIIKEIWVDLHPTFQPPAFRLKTPPFEVTRVGWGEFIIDIIITLKNGYLWHDSKRSLALEWDLVFDGHGSSTSHECGVSVENPASRSG
ncbi:hypothetical protein NP233_g9000 [Leucocoprinus birnbaumii]|uniref:Protein AF-9 homolog n=1 Tax=Leucocoprinus birnbaumii TaxID=56174 RepID=A0AAD5VLE1_9AGAR|nr:hypothetical protein NP233_g9000 [Leucocoprinus birnbaumii]